MASGQIQLLLLTLERKTVTQRKTNHLEAKALGFLCSLPHPSGMRPLTGGVLVLCTGKTRPRRGFSRLSQQNGSSRRIRAPASGMMLGHTTILSDVPPACRAALAAASTRFLYLYPALCIRFSIPHLSYMSHSVFSCSGTLKSTPGTSQRVIEWLRLEGTKWTS